MIISHPLHNSKMFTVHGKILCAEASDFGGSEMCGQLYDDACDEGFSIKSARTGKTEMFYLCDHQEDADGDLMYWIFKPKNTTLRDTGVAVHIFND